MECRVGLSHDRLVDQVRVRIQGCRGKYSNDDVMPQLNKTTSKRVLWDSWMTLCELG